jgi:Ca-activated chloride channel family protein
VVSDLLPDFAAEYAALIVLVLASAAEWLHTRRVRRVAVLAFGPRKHPSAWARTAPVLRALAATAAVWGLMTLLVVDPKRYTASDSDRSDRPPGHILLVLDVSPSMRLVDAGPEKKESRMQRARRVMDSFFERAPIEDNLVSVVAFYNGAKPVVVDTKDLDVVRNILGDLPMHYAFPSGKTKLFSGLEEAARIAHPWQPKSTTLILLSDGDTVPATGMPKMPDSIRSVVVVGVGDTQVGKFIDGRQSRQEAPMLQQIAVRLGGTYHNGNDKQLSTALIAESTGREREDVFERLTRREYALIAAGAGCALLALLPLLLHFFGTRWRPGTRVASRFGKPGESSAASSGRPGLPAASTSLA